MRVLSNSRRDRIRSEIIHRSWRGINPGCDRIKGGLPCVEDKEDNTAEEVAQKHNN